MMQTLEQVLDDASRAIEVATWERVGSFPTDHDAVAYQGKVDGWEFLVVSFSAECGTCRGTGWVRVNGVERETCETCSGRKPRGWDGTGRKGSTVLHLTRELAERGFRLADNGEATSE